MCLIYVDRLWMTPVWSLNFLTFGKETEETISVLGTLETLLDHPCEARPGVGVRQVDVSVRGRGIAPPHTVVQGPGQLHDASR